MGQIVGQEVRQEAVIPLLLDTCALIWLAEEAPMAKVARNALVRAVASRNPICVSPISAWEIGLLIANRQIKLPISPDAWFERALASPQVRLSDLSIGILLASSFLPGNPPRGPVDRIMIATARESGLCLMTRDKNLLRYADEGHVQAIAC